MAEIGAISQIYAQVKSGDLSGRNFAFMKAALQVSSTANASPVYWLSAIQDGVTVIYWVSFVADFSSAPAGHTYTNLLIQAAWRL